MDHGPTGMAHPSVNVDGIVTGRWKIGIFGCLDTCIPNTAMVTFCPCVSLAQVTTRIGYGQYFLHVLLASFVLYILYLILCFVDAMWFQIVVGILSFLMFLFMCHLRCKVRDLFHIPGSIIEDCLCALFCGCCSLAQMATHVESYKPGDCQFEARATLPSFQV
ncbi:hypothetical protein SPRG_11191 [Saprolegnia parasitica CBS 223.65]|uniref:PLAC8 family protein n=1 Tax=Saprolegnia parasitica (strain CBS 223.65) TaxID=695850 RepID=A0A067C9Q5_SAPPC|nr:hypothetical protein SPRG_11191 [Saprolegnia parasitica CBS 223.65]KDO23261.1 hypothetical protein SPRG_11191 [Saprolegnia parasitica CBS 223.65]|eukprot:XP_012206049.1 hypothetical protein SPRG_11191 [Saprolegnia parasitica CBS 223.65]